MDLPVLLNSDIEKIDSLSVEDFSDEINYAFQHELMWYGLDAITHVYFLKEARKESGKSSLIDRFNIFRSREKFAISLRDIQKEGVFFPKQIFIKPYLENETDKILYKERDRFVKLFSQDYENRFFSNSSYFRNLELYIDLLEREWCVDDLKNDDLLTLGIEFGKDLWRHSVEGFNKLKSGHEKMNIGPQKEDVNYVGEKLIEYYSQIILR